METLRGEKVTLRPATEADVPRMSAIASEPTVAPWWLDTDEDSVREEFLREASGAWVIQYEGEVVGAIEYWETLEPHYRYASIDLMLDEAHQGRGLGTDALRTAARWLLAKGHHRLTIDPSVENARAVRAYEKVGFKPVGVMRRYELGPDGRWRDSLLMDMLEGELE
jgi:aminoglycoside 6'-N-acetyltransferase